MSHKCLQELIYTNSHEWIRLCDHEATVGVTDYAQQQLGDLVYVELPALGDDVSAGSEAAVVESVKTAADVYSPVTGQIIAVNEALVTEPELINQDPYDKGWLFKVALQHTSELDNYMTAAAYAERYTD